MQEVALKEKLAQTGKALKKRYTVQPNELATVSAISNTVSFSFICPSQPQSLSRADSGIVFPNSRPHTPDPEDHPLATGSAQPSSSDGNTPQEKVEFVITPPDEDEDDAAKKEEEELLKTVSPIMETIQEEEHEEGVSQKRETEEKMADKVPKEEEILDVSVAEEGKEEANLVENCHELGSDVKEETSVSNGSIVQPEETKKAGEEESEPAANAAPEDNSPTEEEVKQEVKQEDEKVEVHVNEVNQVQSENLVSNCCIFHPQFCTYALCFI